MRIEPLTTVSGAYTVPGDKSITHRAIILNSLAEGEAVLRGACTGRDCESTKDCMRALGAKITEENGIIRIRGIRKIRGAGTLNAGNSATSMRLITAAAAGAGLSCTITGDPSLMRRPVRVEMPLNLMGGKITTQGGLPPVTVKPAPLTGIEYPLPVNSAQVKSAVLLAGLYARGATTIVEPVPTRNHTELMLAAMSADIKVAGSRITVRKSALKSTDINIPGDISSAAYLIVLATVLKGSGIVVRNTGVNPTRRAFVDLINSAGGNIAILNKRKYGEEPAGDLFIQPARLNGMRIEGAAVAGLIDEIPALAVLACFCAGETIIKSANELRLKESDRLTLMYEGLKRMGADITATDDGLRIRGKGVLTGGAVLETNGDHRIAMSLAVACALSVYGGEIRDAESADISFPGFYEIFRKNKA